MEFMKKNLIGEITKQTGIKCVIEFHKIKKFYIKRQMESEKTHNETGGQLK